MPSIGRLVLAILTSQVVAGVCAGVSGIVFLSQSFEEASIVAILFCTLGSVILVPSAFIVEMAIYTQQLRRYAPSIKLQIILSAVIGIGLSCFISLTGRTNAGVTEWEFAVSTGLFSGSFIGLIWFLIVTRPTHEIGRARYLKRSN